MFGLQTPYKALLCKAFGSTASFQKPTNITSLQRVVSVLQHKFDNIKVELDKRKHAFMSNIFLKNKDMGRLCNKSGDVVKKVYILHILLPAYLSVFEFVKKR
ncbi:hypothetical protein EON70_01080 [bacterium]|nr:MAG: hypothetical protein EON70_01080 [bacterium]